MSVKETSVFILGILLVAFLYVMKHPTAPVHEQISQKNSQPSLGIDVMEDQGNSTFDPNTKSPVIESILDIPAWKLDVETLTALTSEELVNSIETALTQQQLFKPEQNNALFYLANLKSIDANNPNIDKFTQELESQLETQTTHAIANNDEKLLTAVIARIKTLDSNVASIKALESQLANIKTINKLFKQGSHYLQDNIIVSNDSQDAWHIAKQMQELDAQNHKSKTLIQEVNNTLINNALRAAEETDFQLAQDQIQQAELLEPESDTLAFAQEQIKQLRQLRYLWLEQQIAIALKQINVSRAEKMLQQLTNLDLPPSPLKEYQNEINRISIFGKYSPFDTFFDVSNDNRVLPKMVVMPTGQFIMGSRIGAKHEKPTHKVQFNYGFAISQNEISVQDFKLFIDNSDYQSDADKNNRSRVYDLRTGRLKNKNHTNWQRNYIGKKAKDDDPVIHVSWNDAMAYTRWLSEQTGKNYRLPTEAEFEYVLRAGSTSLFPWGDDTPSTIIENLTGKLDRSKGESRMKWEQGFEKYNDKFWGPAPVGSFISNPFKLNDTAGNVMEWVMDCWHDSYIRAPIDGSSWTNPGCEDHVIRGGSWSNAKPDFSSSHRFKARANFSDARLGFRIAIDLK